MTLKVGEKYKYTYGNDRYKQPGHFLILGSNLIGSDERIFIAQFFTDKDKSSSQYYMFKENGHLFGHALSNPNDVAWYLKITPTYYYRRITENGNIATSWACLSNSTIVHDASKYLIREGDDNSTITLKTASEVRELQIS